MREKSTSIFCHWQSTGLSYLLQSRGMSLIRHIPASSVAPPLHDWLVTLPSTRHPQSCNRASSARHNVMVPYLILHYLRCPRIPNPSMEPSLFSAFLHLAASGVSSRFILNSTGRVEASLIIHGIFSTKLCPPLLWKCLAMVLFGSGLTMHRFAERRQSELAFPAPFVQSFLVFRARGSA